MEIIDDVLDALAQELLRQIGEIPNCKDVETRHTQAGTVKRLAQSLSAIIDSTSMAAAEMSDYMDDGFPEEDFLD